MDVYTHISRIKDDYFNISLVFIVKSTYKIFCLYSCLLTS